MEASPGDSKGQAGLKMQLWGTVGLNWLRVKSSLCWKEDQVQDSNGRIQGTFIQNDMI